MDSEIIPYSEMVEAVDEGRPAGVVVYAEDVLLMWVRDEPISDDEADAFSYGAGQVAFLTLLHDIFLHEVGG